MRNVDIAIDRVVTKYVEVPIETYRDVIEEREIIIPVEKVVEKRIKRIKRSRMIPKEIENERIVEVPVIKYIDKIITIDKIIEKPIYIEKVVEKKVERIIERRVEVPIE